MQQEYKHNLQNDVIGIIDSNNTLVAKYINIFKLALIHS